MNERDQIIADIESTVGPGYGFKAFGLRGAYDGASQFDKQIATWSPPIKSADAEVLPDKKMIDARARDLWRNDAYVQAGANTHKDSIVGSMFMLNSKPVFKALGKGYDETWSEEFQEEVEALFTLWAESPMNHVDASRQNDLTALIRLAVGVYVFGGEVLATAEWLKGSDREFHTAIQMVDADRLSTPYDQAPNPRVRGGILHDANGAPRTAYIQMQHPNDFRSLMSANGLFWRAVPFRKPWGREQVIHIKEQQRPAQSRALSSLAAGLREVAIVKKFRDVTLQNAVVNASYAATIESELPSEVVFQQLGAGGAGTASDAVSQYASGFLTAVSEYLSNARNVSIDGVKIPHLFPGTKLNMKPMGTPGGVGQDFEASLLRYVAASLDISYEELARDYTKTNYSSARAAMTQTWRFMQSRKKMVADRLANSIFRLWLEEAVNKNRLSTFPARKAGMLYTNGYLNLMFDAISSASWIGASRGQIDELKETQAAVLRLKYGLATHEDELMRLGKDWRAVFRQLEREKDEMTKRGIVLVADDNMMNAASGTPREQDEEAGKDQDADAP